MIDDPRTRSKIRRFFKHWLELEERKSPERLAMLSSREWEGMEAVPVSTYVNNARNEGSACIAPLTPPRATV